MKTRFVVVAFSCSDIQGTGLIEVSVYNMNLIFLPNYCPTNTIGWFGYAFQ